jgi:hypothetical protein
VTTIDNIEFRTTAPDKDAAVIGEWIAELEVSRSEHRSAEIAGNVARALCRFMMIEEDVFRSVLLRKSR